MVVLPIRNVEFYKVGMGLLTDRYGETYLHNWGKDVSLVEVEVLSNGGG